MTSETVTYWGAAIVPPVASFILNWIARGTAALKSSGADWLLILFAFDLTGLFTHSDLARHVVHPELKASLQAILLVSFTSSLILWVLVVLRLEPFMANTQGKTNLIARLLSYTTIWILVITLFAAHITLFTLKP